MLKLYTTACSILLSAVMHAQTVLQVTTGTDLFIQSGTPFYAGGLVLVPSADYILNGRELSRHTTVSHFTATNYASRVLRFTPAALAYSGEIQFYYTDDVLNSIPEASLALNVHNGSYWQVINTASRHATEKYISTQAVSNLVMSEFALSDELVVLPLIWGHLQAVRQGEDVQVNWATRQEQQVSHFMVERSADGRRWETISDEIAATNQPQEQRYTFTDKQAPAYRVYYRIRQQDQNGTVRYSTSVTVAVTGDMVLRLYPNPVQQSFRLHAAEAAAIKKIELYNAAGALVKSWNQAQPYYDIQTLASGSYHVVVQLQQGDSKYFSLQKK